MNVLRTDWTFKRRKCYLRDEQSGELSWCGVIMATLNACKRNNKIPKTPESRPSAPWFLRLLQSKIPLHRGPHSTRMTGPNLRRLEFYSVGVYIVKKWKFVGFLVTAKKARSTIKTDFSIPYRRHCKRIEGILRKIQNIFAKMIGVSTPSLDSRRAAFGAWNWAQPHF